jgi:hypothetical protein
MSRRPGIYVTDDGGVDVVMPRLDVLPGLSRLDAEFDMEHGKVRWRGVRSGSVPMESPWSATYDLGSLPDEICWDDLW